MAGARAIDGLLITGHVRSRLVSPWFGDEPELALSGSLWPGRSTGLGLLLLAVWLRGQTWLRAGSARAQGSCSGMTQNLPQWVPLPGSRAIVAWHQPVTGGRANTSAGWGSGVGASPRHLPLQGSGVMAGHCWHVLLPGRRVIPAPGWHMQQTGRCSLLKPARQLHYTPVSQAPQAGAGANRARSGPLSTSASASAVRL